MVFYTLFTMVGAYGPRRDKMLRNSKLARSEVIVICSAIAHRSQGQRVHFDLPKGLLDIYENTGLGNEQWPRGKIYRGPVNFTIQNSAWPRVRLVKNSP